MRPRPDALLAASEVALALVTCAAVVGMHRLFVDGSYRAPLLLQAAAAHVVVALLRRTGVRLVPAAAITAAVAVLLITWTRFPETALWVLPTPDTLDQLGDDLVTAWRVFGDVRAPAPVENGFIAATAAAVWLLVFVADWAAFRVSATFEALLPPTSLFVFAAALGGTGSPVASAALFSGAALMFVLVHRTSSQEQSSRWAGGHGARGRWSLMGTGGVILAVAVVMGTVAGPNLPGADAEAVVAWRDLNKDKPTRVVLSPMVSLQTSLVEQSNVEVFTVRSERGSYWRLTSLDEFDGEIWRSSYSTDDASGELSRAFETASEGETVSQQVTIEALSSVWLPAAFEPVAIETGEDQPAALDEQSSTLMVDSDRDTSDGYTYSVTSRLPVLDGELLRDASTDIPPEIAETYLQLPDDFSELAATEAFKITGDASTPYDKAMALMRHLRSFTYDTSVGPGHSEDALVSFLFETKRGYCEQFAAAFAALARSAGVPARVAVGFTKGVQDPNDPTLYRVRGIHAHSWPEVYLGEYGWVPFEPTPGRGPPGAESYLGIDEAQDTTGGGGAVGADPLEGQGDGSGEPGEAGAPDGGTRDPDAALNGAATTDSGARKDDHGIVAGTLRQVGRPAGVGLAGYLALVPLGIVAQRWLRRRRAKAPADKARLAWRNVTEGAQAAGVSLPPSLTIAEMADRIAAALPRSSAAVQALARTMEAIAYADIRPSPDEVAGAEHAWVSLVDEANQRRSWGSRILRYLDIRQLFAGRRARLVTHQGPAVDPAT